MLRASRLSQQHADRSLPCGAGDSYTRGMKTAVSVPDHVFAEAERLAKRLKKSRSQVYAEALAEYVARHDEDQVTERVNVALDAIGEPHQDPALAEAVYRVLRDVEW